VTTEPSPQQNATPNPSVQSPDPSPVRSQARRSTRSRGPPSRFGYGGASPGGYLSAYLSTLNFQAQAQMAGRPHAIHYLVVIIACCVDVGNDPLDSTLPIQLLSIIRRY
jgi:hypothetical protein